MKYELIPGDFGYYRIRALRAIPKHYVVPGTLGGLVEWSYNLDQQGDAWITYEAFAVENSRVTGSALVRDRVQLCGEARVGGNAVVADSAMLGDRVRVEGTARIRESAMLKDRVRVTGSAVVGGYARLYDDVEVSGDARVGGHAVLSGNVRIASMDDVRRFVRG